MGLCVTPELRERREDLETIAAAIDDASAGRGSVVFIEGPIGIGKSTLIEAARARARDAGLQVLSARGSELERGFALGVVRQLLEGRLRGATEEEHRRWTADGDGLGRALGLPEAAVRPDAVFALEHRLYQLVASLAADAPLALAIDDAHFADARSVGVLRHLAHRLEGLRVVLLLTCPETEAGAGLLLRHAPGRVLRPAPLSVAAVADWIATALGEPPEAPFARALHEATGGNPLLVGELLREVDAQALRPTAQHTRRLGSLGAEGVARAVLIRLAPLPPAATVLARAAAVLGDGAELGVAAALAGLEETSAAGAVTALVHAGVLARSERLRFVQPIVRTALHGELSPTQRAWSHARAARILHERGGAPDRLLAHLLQAAPLRQGWALDALRAAGSRAARAGDLDAAARCLTRALQEGAAGEVREELLIALGSAEHQAGWGGAEDHLREVVEQTEDPERRARAALELARALDLAGRSGEALALLEEASRALDGGCGRLRALLDAEVLLCRVLSRSAVPEAREVQERAAPAGSDLPEPDPTAQAGLALVCALSGEPEARVGELAERALARVERAQGDGGVLATASAALLLAGRFPRVEQLLQRAEAVAPAGGQTVAQAPVAVLRAALELRRGRLLPARAEALRALDLPSVGPDAAVVRAGAASTLVQVAAERSEPLEAWIEEVPGDDDSLVGALLAHGRAALRVARGDLERGVRELLASGERDGAAGWHGPGLFPWRSEAALGLRQLGERDEAQRLAAEELRLARAFGAPRPLGIALRTCGTLEEGEARLELLREALAVLAPSGAELEHARALVELGAALRSSRRTTLAREPLRQALVLALRCGAERLAARARTELLASGARPRRSALTGLAALTPQERRVVELAARRRTNRQIASALFVTEKTVESHLGRAYVKLGVHARAELAAALRDEPAQAGSS